MRYRPLGQSGLLVSVVGLGCNNFGGRLDADQTRSVVDAAIDVGITLFDTSDTYGEGGGSERALGEILGSRRDQVVLATKFGGRGVDMGYGPAGRRRGPGHGHGTARGLVRQKKARGPRWYFPAGPKPTLRGPGQAGPIK